MSETTDIEWTDYTWGPWEGCTKVSAGCANCYAATRNHRFGKDNWGPGKPRRLTGDWKKPLKWNKSGHVCAQCGKATFADRCGHGQCRGITHRIRVFPSLCDWLDDEVPIQWLARFLQLIHETQNLDWQLLTKRPERWPYRLEGAMQHVLGNANPKDRPVEFLAWLDDWIKQINPPSNVWIGTSVEDQANADRRIPALLKIPAKVRFLSVEPMLGPVDLKLMRRSFGFPQHITKEGHAVGMPQGIHWVIFGGESGPGARPCNVDWIRSGVKQCAAAGVACFVKQLGANASCKWCGKPAKCVGAYNGADTYQPACNRCCGHGNENGHCYPLTHPKGGDLAKRQMKP